MVEEEDKVVVEEEEEEEEGGGSGRQNKHQALYQQLVLRDLGGISAINIATVTIVGCVSKHNPSLSPCSYVYSFASGCLGCKAL